MKRADYLDKAIFNSKPEYIYKWTQSTVEYRNHPVEHKVWLRNYALGRMHSYELHGQSWMPKCPPCPDIEYDGKCKKTEHLGLFCQGAFITPNWPFNAENVSISYKIIISLWMHIQKDTHIHPKAYICLLSVCIYVARFTDNYFGNFLRYDNVKSKRSRWFMWVNWNSDATWYWDSHCYVTLVQISAVFWIKFSVVFGIVWMYMIYKYYAAQPTNC